jgi:hypothetical protein
VAASRRISSKGVGADFSSSRKEAANDEKAVLFFGRVCVCVNQWPSLWVVVVVVMVVAVANEEGSKQAKYVMIMTTQG